MQNKREKRGISLIVLVITIIVMIILAAAIIISLNNTGIISNANKAVNKTDEKTVQEIANLAWGEAYASGIRDDIGLKSAVEKALLDNGLKKEDYGMIVDQKGVDITKGWLQTENRKVVKGTQVLEIGDTINYNAEVEGYTGTWKILGAEDGKLKIMSDTNVAEKTLNEENTLEGAKNAYTNGIKELNKICEAYSKGTGAEYARSITVEDIDSVTGYDKTKYGAGTITAYGNTVTYWWDITQANQKKPYYETEMGFVGNLSTIHSEFIWHDGNTWQKSVLPESLPTTRQKITSLKNTMYYYDVDLNTSCTRSNNAYKMLFGEDNTKYWIASTCVVLNINTEGFCMRYVDNGSVSTEFLVASYGGYDKNSHGVRCVVCLKDDVKITGSKNSTWNISL